MNHKKTFAARAVLAVLAFTVATSSFAMMAKNKADQYSSKVAEVVPGEFLVQMRRSGEFSVQSVKAVLGGTGLEVKQVVNAEQKLYLAKASSATISAMSTQKLSQQSIMDSVASLPDVEYVEPNFVYRALDVAAPALPQTIPNDSDFGKLWGMLNTGTNQPHDHTGIARADIHAPEAWTLSTGSKNVVVAIVDTGVDYTHPDLKDNIWTKPGTTDVHGFNAITGKEDPMDDHSHGSHCAGTIGGVGDNGSGVAGVNWHVSIMGSKFLAADGSGTSADAIKAIDYAVQNGAQIISNSWGGGGFSQALLDSITRARDKGILFVVAAGNDGSNNDVTPSYPANYAVDNIISVAASTSSEEMADFSNYGAKTVHLMAPGHYIYSTVKGGAYDIYSGTSMATPHVTGAAALLKAYLPSLTYAEIKTRIVNSTDKIKAFRRKLVSSGRLNVYNMLAGIYPPGPQPIPETSWSAPVAKAISTPHPYTDNSNLHWEISQPGATFIRVHFTKFATEAAYDVLKLKTAAGDVGDSYSGTIAAPFWSDEIEGSKISLDFTSDNSVHADGFDIDSYEWTSFAGDAFQVSAAH